MDAHTKPLCQNCKFWRELDSLPVQMGHCRRHPPIPVGAYETVFPTTNPTTWCGDFTAGKPPEEVRVEPAPVPIVPLASKPEEQKPAAPAHPQPRVSGPAMTVERMKQLQAMRK